MQAPVSAPVAPDEPDDPEPVGAAVATAEVAGAVGPSAEVGTGATDGAAEPAPAVTAVGEDPTGPDPEGEPAAAVVGEAPPPPPPAAAGTLGLAEQPVGGLAEGLEGPRSDSTESPGSGKTTSVESTVAHPLETEPMLAKNMSGKEARRLNQPRFERLAALRDSMLRLPVLDPPVTVMGAQFMYISLLPTRLNHVQAKVYSPGDIPDGMEKVYLFPAFPCM